MIVGVNKEKLREYLVQEISFANRNFEKFKKLRDDIENSNSGYAWIITLIFAQVEIEITKIHTKLEEGAFDD